MELKWCEPVIIPIKNPYDDPTFSTYLPDTSKHFRIASNKPKMIIIMVLNYLGVSALLTPRIAA